MTYVVDTIEGSKGLRLEIVIDEDGLNPRTDYDNLGTMVCRHKKYNLGDINSEADVERVMSEVNEKNSLIVPIYMYEHSGIALKASPFNDPWDSGQLGIIYVSHENIVKEYGSLSKENIETATRVLVAEVEEYSKYVNGETYGFRILNEDDEVLESCYGFLGLDGVEEEGRYSLKEFEEEYEQHFVFKSVRI